MNDYLAVDLFAGCGGLSEGMKQAGFDIVAAVEIDTNAADCYELNHPEVHLIQKDIRKVKCNEIKKILNGIRDDGRKRALSLLLAFYTSLEFPRDYIEEKVADWNKKNYHPLKHGYLRSQIDWHIKNQRLPPNYDKPIYKEFGIKNPPEPGMKNPINYTIKKAMQAKARSNFQPKPKQEEKKYTPEI